MVTIVSNTPEVRTTRPVTIEVTHLAYLGKGVLRDEYAPLFGVNAGHPASLRYRSRMLDGFLTGRIKVTKMQNTPGADYYSLRLIGQGRKRTVYLRADAQVVLDGAVGTMADVWTLITK